MKSVVVALALALAGTAPVKSRHPAPEFTLRDQSGTPVSLSALKGKVVALDFWATWCAGCKEEIPWFMEFQEKYKRAGLETIGAAMDDEGWEKVQPYIKDHPFNYRIGQEGLGTGSPRSPQGAIAVT